MRLREARVNARLSQKKLGILAGIDEFSASPRINQYEQGKHTPDFSIMERLAAVLKLPVPYFYARDTELAEWIKLYYQISGELRQQLLSTGEGREGRHEKAENESDDGGVLSSKS